MAFDKSDFLRCCLSYRRNAEALSGGSESTHRVIVDAMGVFKARSAERSSAAIHAWVNFFTEKQNDSACELASELHKLIGLGAFVAETVGNAPRDTEPVSKKTNMRMASVEQYLGTVVHYLRNGSQATSLSQADKWIVRSPIASVENLIMDANTLSEGSKKRVIQVVPLSFIFQFLLRLFFPLSTASSRECNNYYF